MRSITSKNNSNTRLRTHSFPSGRLDGRVAAHAKTSRTRSEGGITIGQSFFFIISQIQSKSKISSLKILPCLFVSDRLTQLRGFSGICQDCYATKSFSFIAPRAFFSVLTIVTILVICQNDCH